MPEMISPLADVLKPGRFGAAPPSAAAPLTLSQRRPPAILQLAGWDDFEDAIKPLLEHLGFDGLGDYQTARSGNGRHLMRLAPDRLWLLCEPPLDLPPNLTPSSRLATLDLTHGRWIIDFKGPALEDLLARLAPIDVRERNLPAGAFVQTAINKVSVLIWRPEKDHAQVFCPTSSTQSLWHFITDTAAPLGYDVIA